MKQSTYLCVIYMSRTRKKFILSPFLLDFYFLVKSKMGAKMTTMFGDVTGLQQRHHPWVYIILSRRSKAFHWKQNRFEILQHIKNLMDSRGSINPPPLNHGGSMTFSCTSKGIKSDQRVRETSRWKSVSKAWVYAAKSHSTSTQYRQLRRLIITPTQEYIGAKTVMHDIPCTFRKFFDHRV